MVRGTERKHWIDTVRGICMVAILLFHTEMYYAGRDITPYRCYVHNALATFFFISGYLFCGGRDGGGFRFAHKVKSISRTLIMPYFIFTGIVGAVKIAARHAAPADIFIDIISGRASWFVAALIVAEMLLALVMLITRGKATWLSAVALLSFATAFVVGNRHDPSTLFYEQNLWYANDALLATGIMICGVLYRRWEHLFNRFNTISYTSLLFVILLIIKTFIVIYHVDTVIGSIEISCIPMFLADICVSVAFLVSLGKLIGRLPMVGWTGAHSLVYYFFCGAVPSVVSLTFNRAGFGYNHYWQVIAALAATYAVCTAIAFVTYRYFPAIVGKHGRA